MSGPTPAWSRIRLAPASNGGAGQRQRSRGLTLLMPAGGQQVRHLSGRGLLIQQWLCQGHGLIEAPGGPAWNRLGFGAPGELRIR